MGPGEYRPDPTEGIDDPSKLPKPIIEERSRDYRRRPCPRCGRSCYRDSLGQRWLWDLGNIHAGRSRRLHVTCSVHRCEPCKIYFNADMSDLAPPGARYTQRVIDTAVRIVVEDGLSYEVATWHLWRDHRVYVPWGTIQNWVEASGGKIGADRRGRAPGVGALELLRVHRG